MRTSDNPNHLRGKSAEYRLSYFSSAETETGCINWLGSKNSGSGYGRMRYGGVRRLAHHVAWETTFGPIPEGLQVLHQCDNTYCLNPKHLFLGTNADNVADKVSKGRQYKPAGVLHPAAKFTEQDIKDIRGDTRVHRDIATEYGCCRATISYIKSGVRWSSIP